MMQKGSQTPMMWMLDAGKGMMLYRQNYRQVVCQLCAFVASSTLSYSERAEPQQ